MKYHRLIWISPDSNHGDKDDDEAAISPDSDDGDKDDDEAAAHNYEMLLVMMMLMVIMMMIKINKNLPFSADVANQKRGGVVPGAILICCVSRAKINISGRKIDESWSFGLFFSIF